MIRISHSPKGHIRSNVRESCHIGIVAGIVTPLNELQTRIVEALVSGKRVSDIAREVGCGRVQVWRVRKLPHVAQQLAGRESERLADARAVRDEAVLEAIEYLADVTGGRVPGEQMRLQAAREILSKSPLTTSTPAAEERVRDALEAAAGGASKLEEMLGRHVAEAMGFGKGNAA